MTNSTQSSLDEFRKILKQRGFSGDVNALMEALGKDEIVSKLNVTDRNSAILSALEAARKSPNGTTQLHIDTLSVDSIRSFAENISSGAHVRPPNPECMQNLRRRAAANDAASHGRSLHNASSSDHWLKVNKALGWIGASMMILGAFSSAKGIVSKDENGNREIHVTPLMWTILKGVMGAGILYLTHHQPSTIQNAIR
jgi:hypothetical protein